MIQSDFITLINRESVVACPWNYKLREFTARAFNLAIQELIQHNGFLYNWLEYLPVSPIDGFWAALPKLILQDLKNLPLLRPHGDHTLFPPLKLSVLPESFIHDGEPLFDNPELPTVYASPEYTSRGFRKQLRKLGLQRLTWSEIIEETETDLVKRVRN